MRVWRDGRFVDGPAGTAGSAVETAPVTSSEPIVESTSAVRLSPVAAVVPPPVVGGRMRVRGTVNVRSGPGTYYYEVGKLTEPTTVEVLATEGGWSAISPTSGMKALVRQDAVLAQGNNEGIISATGRARVYALGRSTETWAVVDQLNTGDKVKILATEGNFYQIEMPKAARAWIQSDLLQPATAERTGNDAAAEIAPLPEVKPMTVDPQLKAYQDAAALMQKEMEKDLASRNLEPLEESFKAIIEKTESGYVKAAARDALASIEHQKFLLESRKTVDRQREELDRKLAEIRRQTEQQQTEAIRSTATKSIVAADFQGVLRKNMATSAYPYRLEDNNGRFLAMLKSDTVNLDAHNGRLVLVWGDKRYLADWKIHGVEVNRLEASE